MHQMSLQKVTYLMTETRAEYKKRHKKAMKLLEACDYTPTAARNLANHLCFLTTERSHAVQEQVISAITKIIRGK